MSDILIKAVEEIVRNAKKVYEEISTRYGTEQ